METDFKKPSSKFQKAENENSDFILCEFHKTKTNIENKLKALEKSNFSANFDQIISDYNQLKSQVGESSRYLPSYNVKLVQEGLKQLWENIEESKAQLFPKKKFAFKKASAEDQKAKTSVTEATSISADEVDKPVTTTHETVALKGFKNAKSAKLQMQPEEANGCDLELSDLSDCLVEIFGAPSAVKINNLSDCRVFIGPVTTSIFVADCRNCQFRFACQQLRVHTSRDCQFYLHLTSRGIIEDCKELVFGRLDWNYDGIDQHFELANLSSSTNHWNRIDDFNWLSKEKPSPHFRIFKYDT